MILFPFLLSCSQDSRKLGKFLLQLHHIENKPTKSWVARGSKPWKVQSQGLPKVRPFLQNTLIEAEIVGVEGGGGASAQEKEQPWQLESEYEEEEEDEEES